MGFTVEELVALIGGSHTVGSAHGGCSQRLRGPAEPEPAVLGRPWWRRPAVLHGTDAHRLALVPSVHVPEQHGPLHQHPGPARSGRGGGCGRRSGGWRCGAGVQAGAVGGASAVRSAGDAGVYRGCDFSDGAYQAGVLPCEGVVLRLQSDFWL
eukprot:2817815-Rhodomonas_salina.2